MGLLPDTSHKRWKVYDSTQRSRQAPRVTRKQAAATPPKFKPRVRPREQTFAPEDTDETGLDKAYASDTNLYLDSGGTLYVAGTKGHFWDKEWNENYRDFGEPLVNKLGVTVTKGLQGDVLGAIRSFTDQSTVNVSKQDRYIQLDTYMKANPGKVKNFVGHSKGSAVIDQWLRDNPEFKGKARLYSTPYDDPLGKEKIKDWLNDARKQRDDYFSDKTFIEKAANTVQDKEQDLLEWYTGFDKVVGMKERGVTRIANTGDVAAILDSSAERYDHPNPFKYLSGGGPHDYHEGIARYTSGFGASVSNRPGGFDTNYRIPFNMSSKSDSATPKLQSAV